MPCKSQAVGSHIRADVEKHPPRSLTSDVQELLDLESFIIAEKIHLPFDVGLYVTRKHQGPVMDQETAAGVGGDDPIDSAMPPTKPTQTSQPACEPGPSRRWMSLCHCSMITTIDF